MVAKKPKGLGRGLEALLGGDEAVLDVLQADKRGADARTAGKPAAAQGPAVLLIEQLQAGRYQPRTRMDEEALGELAESIRTQGVMQPILVRPIPGGAAKQAKYEIIAGERRFRAARMAGLAEVPVLVREVDDQQAAVMALIENMQREDLNALEEAQGVHRLLNEFGLTHEQAAQAIGRSRSATTNLLRLLNLAEPVQIMLLAGDIDMGHARALLALDAAQQIQLSNVVVAKRLSVRETERLVASTVAEADGSASRRRGASTGGGRDVARLEEKLSDVLGTKVAFKLGARERGQIVIDFHGWEHLSSLLERQGLGKVLEDL
ncbi:MAG: ParB/RepB/Spo0J family partition protein [Pigmentiphaga sp.]|nr:ParB/RepB/Spo0J family partition protein [Pigmentiphaga sp.]